LNIRMWHEGPGFARRVHKCRLGPIDLKRSQGVTGLDADNTWHEVDDVVADRYKSEYWYDANGNIDTLARYDQDGNLYDGFSYKYKRDGDGRLLQNRLYQLNDLADEDDLSVNEGPGGAEDIAWTDNVPFDPQDGAINSAYNDGYDALGNLVRDTREEIASIEWTVAGKVKRVARTISSGREPLTFGYGADGQRIMKQVGENPDLGTGHREYYVRDAQGNIMAIYRYTNTGTASFRVIERPIYGSSRLGSYDRPRQLLGSQNIPAVATMSHPAKRYELTDHLGNVNTVVTGRLLPGNGAGSAYQAEVVSAQGYEAFGSLLPGRNYSSGAYRFGFNGQEKDDEIYGSTGTSYTAEFWQYDPRVARRWNLDPVDQVSISNYAAFALNPILLVDPKGASATKYEDEAGNALVPETKDGNDATVTIPDGNKEAFLREYR
jgi:RHS repeat-associated protein